MSLNNPVIIPDIYLTKAEYAAKTAMQRRVDSPVDYLFQPGSGYTGYAFSATSSAPGYPASKVFDGVNDDNLSFWASDYILPTQSNPQSVIIQYDKRVFIEGYRLIRYPFAGNGPVSWRVSTSEGGGEWTQRDYQQNIPLNNAPIEMYWDRAETKEQFIKIDTLSVGQRGNNPFVGIYEFAGLVHPDSKLIDLEKVNQPGHGLVAPSAVYLDTDGKYKASIPADSDKHGLTLLVAVDSDNLLIASGAGIYRINLLLGNKDPNAIVYVGANGRLTLERPAIGQNELIMGYMVGDNQIYYNSMIQHNPVTEPLP